MRYINAGDLLPEALVRELQRYVQGACLYVPVDPTQRKGWGERFRRPGHAGPAERAIRRAFRQGASLEALGEAYHLSPSAIGEDRLLEINPPRAAPDMGPPFSSTLVGKCLVGGIFPRAGVPWRHPTGKGACL